MGITPGSRALSLELAAWVQRHCRGKEAWAIWRVLACANTSLNTAAKTQPGQLINRQPDNLVSSAWLAWHPTFVITKSSIIPASIAVIQTTANVCYHEQKIRFRNPILQLSRRERRTRIGNLGTCHSASNPIQFDRRKEDHG